MMTNNRVAALVEWSLLAATFAVLLVLVWIAP
jgi:hypothetical protein